MKRLRHVLVLFSVIALFFVLGCGRQVQPEVICAAPNVVLGNTCCLDANENYICDTKEQVEVKEVVKKPVVSEAAPSEEESALHQFAESFAKAWNKKSYNALHGLFEKNYRLRFPSQEFNFLARKMDAMLGITEVSLMSVETVSGKSTANFLVTTNGENEVYSATIRVEGTDYKMDSFYFFDNLTADAVCAGNDSCFLSYARISDNRNYCDKAGEFRADCIAEFGVGKTLTARIDDCVSMVDFYAVSDCLTSLALKENVVEPCWHNEFDKQTFECMGELAAARKNVEECNTLVSSRGFPGSRLQKTYCILAYVKVSADTDACAKIDRRDDVMLGSMQEGCYRLLFP